LCRALAAQPQTTTAAQTVPRGGAETPFRAEPSGEPFTLTFYNRPIVVFRARVAGRSPTERAIGAGRVLTDLVAARITERVQTQSIEGAALVSVGSKVVFGLTAADVDELSGETVQGVATEAAGRLQQALNEAAEASAPWLLLWASALALVGITGGVFALWGVARARRAVAGKLAAVAARKLSQSGIADLAGVRRSRLLDFQQALVTTVAVAINLVVVYGTLTFVLRRFPYTRPWGESMRAFLLTTVENSALGVANAIPGLVAVYLIFVITRFLVRLVGLWFTAIEQGRIQPRWIFPETAQPSRRLLSTLLWLFAIVVAYPYMPGSGTDAFKGVTVFLGLMLTFGSSGLMNQIMSGFMLTYSRALRLGDFVRIGDIEGTVTHLGVLSTKVKTLLREEVTLPNAVVVAQTTTDYSRNGDVEGIFTSTSVTIGYDAPWRQVHALLLLAAERTPGLRKEPKPLVFQTALEDFYVKYTLWVSLERQQSRLSTLHALHAHIQDLFNEYGVQIMSPNYVIDPASPKVVPKKDWFAAPARGVD
jgi:small-conductance mechanosensitive channel